MESLEQQSVPQFSSPEEELAFLREHAKKMEQQSPESENRDSTEEAAKQTIEQYKKIDTEKVVKKSKKISSEEHEQIQLRLSPEPHDRKMEELLGILLERGIKNTLDVIRKMKNPHIDDDFHRFLVQYLRETDRVPGLKEGTPTFKGINMTLFEVTLPQENLEEGKTFKDIIGAMEQFYAGMQSVSEGKNNKQRGYFSLELALSNDRSDLVVYAAVPKKRTALFEKHILSFYEKAKIQEVTDDYNVFHANGSGAGAYAFLSKSDILPIKTHEDIDHDPMKALLNVFSKLKDQGEGAAVQFVIVPAGDSFVKRFSAILDDVKHGKSVKEAYGVAHSFGKALWTTARDIFRGEKDQPGDSKKEVDTQTVETINKKLSHTIVGVNVRVIASAESAARAEDIVQELTSAFNQFEDPNGNGISFDIKHGRDLSALFHEYSYRMAREDRLMALNIRELSSLFHFPVGVADAPQLKQAKAGQSSAPLELSSEGILIGKNTYRGEERQVYIEPEARVRHFYVIGQTGTGKTNILKNMIIQDIEQGHGCCFIDPHGSDVQDILANVPVERIDDVIYFDPAHTARPMGLNMLEYDPAYPEQKTFVVNEMLSIFNKLFDMKVAGGPMFEQYFRNATMLAIDNPHEPATLLEISRVLADESFRKKKIAEAKNPVVVQFWEEIAAKAGGEASLQNIVPYITSKFDVFLNNDIMRPIIGQEKSAFNFRNIMDEQKILLVNLSKGRLGDINANLLGLILVGKILMATLSRVDAKERPDFHLYIDEFQNVTTDSISQILSEARKYRLSLHIAHQFIGQLPDEIRDAVFGNVGNMAVFRVGAADAEFLEPQVAPTFKQDDILNLDNFHAYVRLLVNNQPTKPFSIETYPAPEGNMTVAEKLKEISYLTYGKEREIVDAGIMERYQKRTIETDR